MSAQNLLIYGAYGYTGELICQLAHKAGMTPVLAGRSAEKLASYGERFETPTRAFGLDDPDALDRGLEGIDVVLHCAGPFVRTWKPMAEACLRNGIHYLDITGEIDVFEALARCDEKARQAGVMLMPGTGFDVVPSDCLAAHVASRLPEATHLELAFLGLGGVSHGTAATMAESLHKDSSVRLDGRITAVPSGKITRKIDFGHGKVRTGMSIPWGDVSTAYYSTRIPNIRVYMAAPKAMRRGARVSRRLGFLLGSAPVQKLVRKAIDARLSGPTDAERAAGMSLLWGEARIEGGPRVVSRLKTPEGYTLTAMTALEIARRVLAGDAPKGFQTPSMAYGADFILSFDGVEREDVVLEP
jgi:short subunit dehydrogenase-like uncharacterized protein